MSIILGFFDADSELDGASLLIGATFDLTSSKVSFGLSSSVGLTGVALWRSSGADSYVIESKG
jgi:hypothetical protein